jgi:hypothetical protein
MDEDARIRATPPSDDRRRTAGEGGILAALRHSPLVGADLDLARSREAGRKIDL